MHLIRFWQRVCSRPSWRSSQRSPGPLAGFKPPTSKGKESMGRVGDGKEKGKGRVEEGRRREREW